MPRRRHPIASFEDPTERRIDELERELYRARDTLLRMTGPVIEEILRPPYDLTSDEVWVWFHQAMKKILELAKPLSGEERNDRTYWGDRAPCPLCGESAQSFYKSDDGFAFPEGLRWHLNGDRRARQCDITREALAHAHALAKRRQEPGV